MITTTALRTFVATATDAQLEPLRALIETCQYVATAECIDDSEEYLQVFGITWEKLVKAGFKEQP